MTCQSGFTPAIDHMSANTRDVASNSSSDLHSQFICESILVRSLTCASDVAR